jgi:crossover junction endodeoxyribonuclease RuvC
LGIDASLRATGVGVVEAIGSRFRVAEFGVIRTPAGRRVSECLRRLDMELGDLIDRARPSSAAIEGAFFFKNIRTAMVLGEARGVAMAACARAGLPIYEYAPRRVKQAVVGFGSASKEQVQKMVMTLLNLGAPPQEDAGDALAIAICHFHSISGSRVFMPEPV